MMIGGGNQNRVLAVVLLAKLAAILTRYANRVLALLRISRVIEYPGFDGTPPLYCRPGID
jgi:hypothetical protein